MRVLTLLLFGLDLTALFLVVVPAPADDVTRVGVEVDFTPPGLTGRIE
jgi:hypothetical protein